MKKTIVLMTSFLSLVAVSAHGVVGNLSGDVNVASGSLNYTLPIGVPESLNGLEPNIAVKYSQHGSAGLLGAGFTLSVSSAISRCTPSTRVDGFKSGIEYSANARFCVDGQQLLVINGENGDDGAEYRALQDNNIRYFSYGGSNHSPDYWEVHAPDGYKYRYENVSGVNTKFSNWMLTEKRDLFGNTLNYNYSSGHMPNIQSITYPGYQVAFVYEDREQPLTQYREGQAYTLDKRLAKITLTRNSSQINEYRFIYENIIADNGDNNPLMRLKRLSQIEKCFGASGQDGCLRPVTFGYQAQPDSSIPLDTAEDRTLIIPRSYYAYADQQQDEALFHRPSYTAGDVNNDGLPDVCYYRVDTGVVCAVSQNGGDYAEPQAWTGNLGYEAKESDFKYYSQIQLIDLNADNYLDFCITDSSGLRCGTNNGGSGFTNVSHRTSALNHDSMPAFAYVDSDEYPDICGMNASLSNYNCYSGATEDFSQQILSLDNTVHHQSNVSWHQQNCSGANCVTTHSETKEINMPSPQWIDIDGDVDNDLCWLSTASSGFYCVYRTTDETSKDIQFSAPQLIYDFDYSLFSSLAINTGVVDSAGNTSNEETTENAIENARRFVSGFRLVDLNADGLPDLCYLNGNQLNCSVNNGNGFEPETTWLNLSNPLSSYTNDEDLRARASMNFSDMNYDGLPDLCMIHGDLQRCAYNQLDSFSDLQARQDIAADVDSHVSSKSLYENFVRQVFRRKTKFIFSITRTAYGNILNLSDINGDGFGEFCYRSIHGVMCTTKDNFGPAALLTSVTDSFGQTTDIRYSSLLKGGLYEAAESVPTGFTEKPNNAWVVDTITSDTAVVQNDWPNNTPIRTSQSYRYGGLLHNKALGVSGYSHVRVMRNERNAETKINLSLEEYLVGKELTIEESINGQRLKTKTNQFSVEQQLDGTHRIRLDSVQESQYDLDGSLVSTSLSTTGNLDSYGYPQQSTLVKTLNDTGETVTTVTDTDYFHDTAYWLLARPDQQTVTHQYNGESITRVVDYTYEDGVLKSETIQPDAPNASTIAYHYDAAGNADRVTTSGNGQQRSVTKTFDELGRVLTQTNSLNQTETYTYHPYCNGVATHTDLAGRVSSNQYDFACRQQSAAAPDANGTSWEYQWATDDDNSFTNQAIDHPYDYRNPIVYKVTETHAVGTWTTRFYDGAGRVVRTESTGFSSDENTRAVVNDVVYDSFGRQTASTLPYYRVNGSLTTPSWVRAEYDEASRVQYEHKTGADGLPLTVSYSYDGKAATISYSDYSKTTVTGVFDQPLTVDENGLTASYTYDPMGNLKTTTQNGNTNQVDYDSRGFKSRQVDPAMGDWRYQHDAFGDLVWQGDAKNQEVSFVYDELGRLVQRVEPEGVTTWEYYSSGNGIGQLYREVGIEATKQWAYDSLGRTTSETLTIGSQSFTTSYEYDAFSRLVKTINPDGLEVFNDFDSTGAVDEVSIPANQLQGMDFGSIDVEYDAVLGQIIDLESDIARLEQRRNYHFSRALYYEGQANTFAALLEQVTSDVDMLVSLAEEHENMAAAYDQKIDDLRARYQQLRREYGAGKWTHYRGIVTINGEKYYEFKRKWCKKRRWDKTCKKKATRYVHVKVGNINPVETDTPVYFFQPTDVEMCTTNPSSGDENCITARKETPGCFPHAVGKHIRYKCTEIKGYEVWSAAIKRFEAMRDIALDQAATYREGVQKDLQTDVYMPVAVTKDTFVPIGTDIIIMIPLTITVMEKQWQKVTLQTAAEYYQSQIDQYRQLAQDELDNYNTLSDEYAGLQGEFDDLYATRNYFAEILENAGIMEDPDYTAGEIIDDAREVQEEWQNRSDALTIWAATMRAPSGLLQNELFGNGLYTKRTIDPNTGLVTAIETSAYTSTTPLRHIEYSFNSRGLMTDKNDTTPGSANNTWEHYDYDVQGRLRGWTFNQTLTDIAEDGSSSNRNNHLQRTYDYDDRGNMTYKTGAGLQMHYNQANQITSRDLEAGLSVAYTYDSNGNMISGDGRQYQWNSFNKVNQIADTSNSGINTVNFRYDASHKRLMKQTDTETIYYINPSYERIVRQEDGQAVTIHRHNIWNGHDVVASFEKRESVEGEIYTGDEVAYYHRDHNGSGELVTGADMSVIAQRLYTPYGELVEEVLQRQDLTASSLAVLDVDITAEDYKQEIITRNEVVNAINLLSEAQFGGSRFSGDLRGYTSHETIKEFGLVNMNARLYDPVIGRFISADSMIPEILTPLDHNRYAYVRNNPISYRDPTGHAPWVALAVGFFVVAHMSDSQDLQVLSSLMLAAALANPKFGLYGSTSMHAIPVAGFTAATVTYLRTGDVSASVESALWAGISAGVAKGIGSYTFEGQMVDSWALRAAAHGLSGGIIGEMRDGDFAAGFTSGLAGSMAGSAVIAGGLDFPEQMAITALVGYVSAEAAGGDGVQGAINAAIVFFYNHHEHEGGGAQEGERRDLGFVGNRIRDRLNTDIGKDYFERYWLGEGDLKLTDAQFADIASSVDGVTPITTKNMGDNVGKLFSFYAINEGYAEAYGSAWVVYDNKGTAIGFRDYYDFDAQDYGTRGGGSFGGYIGEAKTRAVGNTNNWFNGGRGESYHVYYH